MFEEACAYCRVNIDELTEDEMMLFNTLLEAQCAYLENAGVVDVENNGPIQNYFLYKQVVFAMMLDAWDKRGAAMDGISAVDNPAIRRAITQLKLTAEHRRTMPCDESQAAT